MKLGISDQGFNRLAQELEDINISGEVELLNSAVESLKQEDILVTMSEIEYLVDMLNNTPSGKLGVMRLLRTDPDWRLSTNDATKVLDILAPVAHEMLDYDFARSQE